MLAWFWGTYTYGDLRLRFDRCFYFTGVTACIFLSFFLFEILKGFELVTSKIEDWFYKILLFTCIGVVFFLSFSLMFLLMYSKFIYFMACAPAETRLALYRSVFFLICFFFDSSSESMKTTSFFTFVLNMDPWFDRKFITLGLCSVLPRTIFLFYLGLYSGLDTSSYCE